MPCAERWTLLPKGNAKGIPRASVDARLRGCTAWGWGSGEGDGVGEDGGAGFFREALEDEVFVGEAAEREDHGFEEQGARDCASDSRFAGGKDRGLLGRELGAGYIHGGPGVVEDLFGVGFAFDGVVEQGLGSERGASQQAQCGGVRANGPAFALEHAVEAGRKLGDVGLTFRGDVRKVVLRERVDCEAHARDDAGALSRGDMEYLRDGGDAKSADFTKSTNERETLDVGFVILRPVGAEGPARRQQPFADVVLDSRDRDASRVAEFTHLHGSALFVV
jgi:hypothetical protein